VKGERRNGYGRVSEEEAKKKECRITELHKRRRVNEDSLEQGEAETHYITAIT
jgi:hypothetical protein